MGISALLAMGAMGIASAPVGLAATGGWSLISSQNVGELSNKLQAATCVTASDCWAVGTYVARAPGGERPAQTLTEHYNGSGWGVVASPNESNTEENHLLGVTCTSATNCWAVGKYFPKTGSNSVEKIDGSLIEHYDGTEWRLVSAPSPGTGTEGLEAVTCVDTTDCWAVGNYRADPLAETPNRTLIEHYDGNSEDKWSVVSSPNPTGPPGPSQPGQSYLNGVSCAGAGDCWAVGVNLSFCPGSATEPREFCFMTLAEHYDGTEWSLVSSPNPAGIKAKSENELNSVSCASSSYCVAVGHDAEGEQPARPLIMKNTGSGWEVVGSPGTGLLNGVSCRGMFCVAVGRYAEIMQQGTAGAWTVTESAHAGSVEQNELYGVTCTSGCFAVGESTLIATGIESTLIEQYGPLPTITALSPSEGPPYGGNSVTITGSGFEEVRAVKFGSADAKSFTVNSPTSITAVAPAGVGTVEVTVTTSAGATGASAADDYAYAPLPLLGRCVNVGSGGGYETSSCLTVSPGRTGAYEWLSGPGAKPAFGGWIGGAILETTGKVQIVCSSGTLSGEWTGAKTAQAKLVLKGCANPVSTASCQSSSSAASEIKTEAPLEAELGFIRGSSRPKVGLDLKAKGSSATLLSFSCGALSEEQWTLEGSVIGRIRGLDVMKASLSLTYTALGGKQVPERFEGGVKETLIATRISTSGKSSEQTGLTLLGVEKPYFVVRNAEKLEIKAK